MAAETQWDDDGAEHFDDRLILRHRDDRIMLLRIVCRVLVALQIAGLAWLTVTSALGRSGDAFVQNPVADFVVVGGFIAAAPFSLVGVLVVSGPAWAGTYEWGSVLFGVALGVVTIVNWCVFALLVRFAARRP
jgi:hypothetical protein